MKNYSSILSLCLDFQYMDREKQTLCEIRLMHLMGDKRTDDDDDYEMPTILIFSYFQETYGSMDLEKEGVVGSGWFTEDANEITTRFGGQWKTANFQAGDVLVFTQRWLPMSEIADSRYVGDFDSPERPKYGIEGRETKTGERNTTMDTKKKQWGFL
ncbi:hypothetical protein AC249_AIPGENE5183 [Exaiptasia diaphana]|nr:hypothetical protein AC249_AIPGENE5183 [Exaiptasia diaphana]